MQAEKQTLSNKAEQKKRRAMMPSRSKKVVPIAEI